MAELYELNRYLHDFSAAMWVAGSALVWLMAKRARSAPQGAAILAAALSIAALNMTALAVALVTGGLRAAGFMSFEHVGPLTAGDWAILAAKHVFFAGLVAWGIAVHRSARRHARERAGGGA